MQSSVRSKPDMSCYGRTGISLAVREIRQPSHHGNTSLPTCKFSQFPRMANVTYKAKFNKILRIPNTAQPSPLPPYRKCGLRQWDWLAIGTARLLGHVTTLSVDDLT